ncbi:MAG TPA: carboxypeptidase-like regulatory domain-containing protein [Trebonia sp.]
MTISRNARGALRWRAPTGTITGTVTDAGIGKPVAGSKVAAPGTRSGATTTTASGRFTSPLAVGTSSIAASTFDYSVKTVTSIAAAAQQTWTTEAAAPYDSAESVYAVIGNKIYVAGGIDPLPVSDY